MEPVRSMLKVAGLERLTSSFGCRKDSAAQRPGILANVEFTEQQATIQVFTGDPARHPREATVRQWP